MKLFKTTRRDYSETKPISKAAIALPKHEEGIDNFGSITAIPKARNLPPIPSYLNDNYWWAYVNPTMIRLLDKKILVNMLLMGNFPTLRNAALDELSNGTKQIQGRTLQAACVYADLTENIVKNLAPGATLDVVDVVPAQLENLQRKLHRKQVDSDETVSLSCCNVEDLHFEDNSFDNVLFFFLFHELPTDARLKALQEANRVLKPGGKIVFIDYHKPESYMWQKIAKFQFDLYEPFAMDMWTTDISEWLPDALRTDCNTCFRKEVIFDGLFQKYVVTKPKSCEKALTIS